MSFLGGFAGIFQAGRSDYGVNKKIKDKDEVQGPLSLRPLNTGVTSMEGLGNYCAPFFPLP